MATPEEIRKIAEQVSARTKFYNDLSIDPESQESFVSSVEQTFSRVDAALKGRYRSVSLTVDRISRTVGESEQNPEVDLLGELRGHLRILAGNVGVKPRAIISTASAVFGTGIDMLQYGFTDINQLNKLKGKAKKARNGPSPIVRKGATFTPSKVGPPSMYHTHLPRRITE